MARKESREFSLFGELDGMTVADIREWLDQFPDDARLDVRSEYKYGTVNDPAVAVQESFVFVRDE